MEINGEAVHGMSEKERIIYRRNHLGYVFQYMTFVDLLTLMEIPEDKIHDAACKLEHGVTDEIFYYMRNWLDKEKKRT